MSRYDYSEIFDEDGNVNEEREYRYSEAEEAMRSEMAALFENIGQEEIEYNLNDRSR